MNLEPSIQRATTMVQKSYQRVLELTAIQGRNADMEDRKAG
jgi:hypothetical protein